MTQPNVDYDKLLLKLSEVLKNTLNALFAGNAVAVGDLTKTGFFHVTPHKTLRYISPVFNFPYITPTGEQLAFLNAVYAFLEHAEEVSCMLFSQQSQIIHGINQDKLRQLFPYRAPSYKEVSLARRRELRTKLAPFNQFLSQDKYYEMLK